MRPTDLRGFVGGAYKAASWKASNQRCLNLYLEEDPEQGAVLYGTPGHLQIAAVGAAPVLAMLATPSGLLIVTADGVYWATGASPSGLTGLTTVSSLGSSYAVLGQAGDQILMVNGDQGYAIDRISQTFTPVPTSGGFPVNPLTCTAVDGYFLAHGPDTDQVFYSNPFDPLTWDALDFIVAENLNDKTQRVIAVERELYLIGTISTEIWATNASTDPNADAFERIQGTYIPYGTSAPLSAAVIGQSLFFLSQDENGGNVIIKCRGLQWERVSTHAIEQEISTYSVTNDAYGFVYQQRGHPFYVITFPSARKTWVYDLATGLWHERSTRILDPVQPDQTAPFSYVDGAWAARCHAFFNDYNLIGSNQGPGVSILSPDYYSDNGVDIVRLRTSPHVSKLEEEMTLSTFEVVFRPGVGNGTGLGPSNDPIARLRISRDGGRQWGPARSVIIGKQGDYLARSRWNRLGRARDFVAEVTVSAQVPVAINRAVMTLTP